MLPEEETSPVRHVIDASDAAAATAAFTVSEMYSSHSCDRAKRDVRSARHASEYLPCETMQSTEFLLRESTSSHTFDGQNMAAASDDRTQTHVKVIGSDDDDNELPAHVRLLYSQTVDENDLKSEVECNLKHLLRSHIDTFAKSSDDLGFCSLLEHGIDTGDARPIKQSPRRPPLAACDAENEILDEKLLETGVIEPSNSAWASPVCLVKKKDGTYRFCFDYRRVNAASKRDAFPIPGIQDALDHLRGATFDLLSGYWQLGMTERAKERSVFCTRRRLFHFTRMPFGSALSFDVCGTSRPTLGRLSMLLG